MAIERMKKLRLMAVKAQKDDLLRDLMLLGCVEVSEPDEILADEELSALTRRESSDLTRCRTDHSTLSAALRLLDKYAPAKSRMLAPKPEISPNVLLDESGLEQSIALAAHLEGCEDKLRRIGAEEIKQLSLIESLRPWEGLDMPLEYQGTKYAATIPGMLPAASDLDKVREELYAQAPESQLNVISSDREQHYVLLIVHSEVRAEAIEALRAHGFSLPSLGSVTGTAGENIAQAEAKITQLAREKEQCIGEIRKEAGSRDSLKLCTDRLATKISRAEAEEKLMGTETAVTLIGWVLERQLPELIQVLEKYDCAWEVEDPREEEIEENQVPVKLRNNTFTAPLNMVTEMYSLPAYNGLDPNPLMAPFFILFYGMMLADMGYGLLMLLAGIIVTTKARRGGTLGEMFRLAIPCGISAFLWGAATGGFFGDFIPQIIRMYNPESTFVWFWDPLFTPLDNTIQILIGSMILGFFQLITGTVISFIKKAKAGQLMDAIFDEGSIWVLFGGLIMLALAKVAGMGSESVASAVSIVGGVMFLYGSTRSAKGLGKLTAPFGAIYNTATGYFGDILSYSRLMALMLAGSVIAQVFNTIGAIPGNIFVFLLISIFGNTLNFALNVLGCFVHDLRLQCLEYFGKFYEDGGRRFQPLKAITKYVNVNADK